MTKMPTKPAQQTPRTEPPLEESNRGALTLTIIILAIMAAAITIDASSELGLALLAILLMGGLITSLAVWG